MDQAYDEGEDVAVTVLVIVVADAVTVGAKQEAQSEDARAEIEVALNARRQLSALQVVNAPQTLGTIPRAARRSVLCIMINTVFEKQYDQKLWQEATDRNEVVKARQV